MLYGILNAVLYSSLLPLWEGFDEPFHYCYVQSISVERRLPVLGSAACSQEVWQSLNRVPVSHVVRQNIQALMPFAGYFRLSAPERRRLRAEVESLPNDLKRTTVGGPLNYEAQQAPLAYALLAIPDLALRGTPLLSRILWLRMFGAVFSAVAVGLLTLRIASLLELPSPFRHAAVFVALATQMLYAATAHITNDWLAIPLALLMFVAAVDFVRSPGLRSAAILALALSAGLLTKAYFLSFAPLAAGAVIWLAGRRRIEWTHGAVVLGIVLLLGGPWYARNVALYDSLSGTQQSASGLGFKGAAEAVAKVDWAAAVVTMARQSLWTGNNSDTAFSANTIACMWLLLLFAAGCWLVTAIGRRLAAAEAVILAGAVLFCAGIAYATALLHIYTQGVSKSTGQWYTQAFFAPLLCVLFTGLARCGRLGRLVAALMVCLWGYVMAATYVAKLIPQYGGWTEGSVRLASLLRWYRDDWARITDILSTTALARPGTTLGLTLAVVLLSAAIPVSLCRELLFVTHRKSAGTGSGELRPE